MPNPTSYNPIIPLRFWCQKVIPLVYDNSLSYYEVLCKVVDTLNQLIAVVNPLGEGIEKTIQQELNKFKVEWEAELQAFQAQVNKTINDNNEAINARLDGISDEVAQQIANATGPLIQQVNELTLKHAQDVAKLSQDIITTDNNNRSWTLNQLELFRQSLPDTFPPILDPSDGETEDIQTVINHIWNYINTGAITAEEYDNLNLTAQAYDAKNLTAKQYDTQGRYLLGVDTTKEE